MKKKEINKCIAHKFPYLSDESIQHPIFPALEFQSYTGNRSFLSKRNGFQARNCLVRAAVRGRISTFIMRSTQRRLNHKFHGISNENNNKETAFVLSKIKRAAIRRKFEPRTTNVVYNFYAYSSFFFFSM